VSPTTHRVRVVKAYILTFLVSIAWTVMMYLPYARFMASFSYANGDEPGFWEETFFSVLVVAGNLSIAIVALLLIKGAGYRFFDDEECSYMGLYTFALLLNLVLDMLLTAYLSYRQMVGAGVHAADGRLMSDIKSLQQIFESYPMQKSVGKLLFAYCWPATFFVPFLAEPLIFLWLPRHIGMLFVRANAHLRGKLAEQALSRIVMDQTRYGDVLVNVVVVCFIPFFAPAYVLPAFGALVFSHAFIYLYDHYKVVRGVARFWFVGVDVNRKAQTLFSITNGLLLSAVVFKLNQMSGRKDRLGSGILQGYTLGACLALAFLSHCVVHVFVVGLVIPRLAARQIQSDPSETYAACARRTPCTWFSSNPVHCLRSKHVFRDNPPQGFHVVGKEASLRPNPKIGAHYDPAEQAAEAKAAVAAAAAEGKADPGGAGGGT